jgi:hypothetical protein
MSRFPIRLQAIAFRSLIENPYSLSLVARADSTGFDASSTLWSLQAALYYCEQKILGDS